MSDMATAFNIQHRPTVAYSPWVNGTVKRLKRDVRVALRAMLEELKLAPQDWVSVIDIILSVLNEAPETHLGRNNDGKTRSPLEVMTGIRPRRAILQVIQEHDVSITQLIVDRAKAERLCKIADLQAGLYELHKDVNQRIDA